MMKRVSFTAFFCLAFTFSVSAQSTFHSAFLSSYNQATGKVLQLADAFSQDQLAWRPAEGIRSVSEAMMHVASANFFFSSMLGAEVPEGINPQELESSVTNKAEVARILKMSVEHARKAIEKTSAEALDDEVDLFGNESTNMGLILLIGDHANEHLGQLIAYARSTGVVPPWSN